MAAEKSELMREGSTLKSKLVAEKQHAAVLQVFYLSCACVWKQLSVNGHLCINIDAYARHTSSMLMLYTLQSAIDRLNRRLGLSYFLLLCQSVCIH